MQRPTLWLVPFAFLLTPSIQAQHVLYEVHGDDTNAFLRSAHGHGDLDGDGRSDLLVSSMLDGGGRLIRAYSGRDGSVLLEVSILEIVSDLAFAGDVNRDGFDDVVVGMTRDDSAGHDAGALEVHSGKDWSQLHRWTGVPGEWLGYGVSGAGDVDADGYDDVVEVGVPLPGGLPSSTQVFSGRDGSVLFRKTESWALLIAAVGLGDTNGDGYSDVGQYWNRTEARIYSGRDFRLLHSLPAQGELVSVLDAGDVDADGNADLALSQIHVPRGGTPVSNAVVYSGRTGLALYTFWSTQDRYFGAGTGAAADINQDGYGDLIVPDEVDYDTGAGHGSVLLVSGREGAVLATLHGKDTQREFGTGAHAGGDIDGDAIPDLVLSLYDDRAHPERAGAVIAFSGAHVRAFWANYGDGWPGSGGVPAFALSDTPRMCESVEARIDNSRPADTIALVLAGAQPASVLTDRGGRLLVLPDAISSVPLPESSLVLPLPLPCAYDVVGATFYLQVLELDPGASHGVSFSRGLRITLGY